MTDLFKDLPPGSGIGAAIVGALFALAAYLNPKREKIDSEFRERVEETKRVAAKAAHQVELLRADYVGRVDLHRARGDANDRLLKLNERVSLLEREYLGLDRRLTEINDGIKRFEGKFERWVERHDDREQRGDRS